MLQCVEKAEAEGKSKVVATEAVDDAHDHGHAGSQDVAAGASSSFISANDVGTWSHVAISLPLYLSTSFISANDPAEPSVGAWSDVTVSLPLYLCLPDMAPPSHVT